MVDNVFRTRVVAETSQFVRELRQLNTKFGVFDVRLDLEGFESGRAVKEVKNLERAVVRSFANIRQEVGKAVRSFVALERSIGGSRDNLSRLTTGLKNVRKSTSAVATSLDRAEQNLRQFASAKNISALGAVDQRFDQLSASLRVTRNQVQRTDASMSRFRQNNLSKFTAAAFFGTASAVLAAGFAARAIAGTITEIAKLNAEFDLLARRTAAISDATEDQAAKLRATALQLGETTIFTAREAASAQAELAKAGFEVTENLAALPGVLDLAAAGQVELKEATLIMARTLRGFNLEASESARVTDVLAAAAVNSAVGVTDLGQAIRFVAPLAVQTGIAMEEVTAAVGLLGDAGFVGGIAGRGLRRALVNLVAPSNRSADAMRALGLEIDATDLSFENVIGQLEQAGATTADVINIFGVRAGPQMAALLNVGSEAIADYTEELEEAGGTAERIADEQLGGLQGAIIRLQSAFETLRIRFVSDSGLDNVLRVFIDEIRFALPALEDALTRVFDPVRDFLALVQLKLGPALAALGGEITNSFVQVLEDGFNFLIENGDDLLAFLQGFITTLSDALSLLLDVADAISNLLPAGLSNVLGALLALKIGVGVVKSLSGAFANLATLLVGKGGVALGLAGLKTLVASIGFGPLAIGIGAVVGGIVALKVGLDALNRPSRVADGVTRDLTDAFADALADTGSYADALERVADAQEEIRVNAAAKELQDDVDLLNELNLALFKLTGEALPAVTLENIFDPEILKVYRDELGRTADAQNSILAEQGQGRATDFGALESLFPILGIDAREGLSSLDEIFALTGAIDSAISEQDSLFNALADAQPDLDDAGGIGEVIDRFELKFLREVEDSLLTGETLDAVSEALLERSEEFGSTIRTVIADGLTAELSKPLSFDKFDLLTPEALIEGAFGLDEDFNLTELREGFQTNVLDVIGTFNEGLAADLAETASGADRDRLLQLSTSFLPFATQGAGANVIREAEANLNEFIVGYTDAVSSGIARAISDEQLTKISAIAVSGQEGALFIETLNSLLASDPGLVAEVIDGADLAGFTSQVTDAFTDPQLLAQYGSAGLTLRRELLGGLSGDLGSEFGADDLNLIDEAKFRSATGFIIPEIQEIRNAANTADLAARQAATDVLNFATTVAQDTASVLADGGTLGGRNLTTNLADEMTAFTNNTLPSLVADINRKLVFEVTVNANSAGLGRPRFHDGGFVYGPRGGEVPATLQQGEFVLQRRAVKSLLGAGVDLRSLNNGNAAPVSTYNNSRNFESQVHIHTNTSYPETHGAKAAKEIELMARRNF